MFELELKIDLGMTVDTCNYSIEDMNIGGSGVQGQPELPSELKVNLNEVGPCLIKKIKLHKFWKYINYLKHKAYRGDDIFQSC